MTDAEDARAVLLTFAQRLHRARGLSRLDVPPSAEVVPCGDGWRATAHLLGRRVVTTGNVAGCEDGDAGVWCEAATPAAAVAGAIEAWRDAARRRFEEARSAEASAREAADDYRRICAEVGA